MSITSAAHRPGEQSITRILMCEPTAYSLQYEINPWMKLGNSPDTSLAAIQWRKLYESITEKGCAEVELVPQADGCPDMVFTANAGLTRGGVALLARFRHPERRVEEPHFRAWFESHGYHVVEPPEDCRFEGEGDALFAGDALVAGYLKRSDICSHSWMAEILGMEVLSVELVDDRWYHLDTCFFPVSERTVVYYPGAFDRYGCTVIEQNFDAIHVSEEEALRFACNALSLGRFVILPQGCPLLSRELEARGFQVAAVAMSEFLKAGGAAKCLSLFLR